jgi:sulfotransferase family protein
VQVPIKKDEVPDFLLLVGMARSGTSWIGKIFDSHPWSLYKHEPDRILSGVPMAPRLVDSQQFATPIRRFFEQLPLLMQTHTAGSLPIFPKQYRSAIAQQIHRASVLVAIAAETSLKLKLPILQLARVNGPGIKIVWKSIDSLGRLGVILNVMEDCRAIQITRHPCASISSTLRGEAQRKFSSSVSASEDYGIMQVFVETAVRNRGLTVKHLRQLHPVERLAWIWVLANEKAAEETKVSPRCTTVRYEDVCLNPTTTMKELFSFSGLEWTHQTSDFIKASTLGIQPGKLEQLTQDSRRYYGIFREPLKAAHKWKSEMKPEDIERVYRVLRQSDLITLYPESETVSARLKA